MLVLLSPAKSLDFDKSEVDVYSIPVLLEETDKLVNVMRKKSAGKLKKLMHISDQLADLNVMRYKHFDITHNPDNSKQAILSFKGDVYRGLNAEELDNNQLAYAQDHIRILSGLYGVLKPLDLIQPYRLEMGLPLRTTRGKNVYEFWKSRITVAIQNELTDRKIDEVINLASKEYFSAIKADKLQAKIFHIHFKEYRNGQLKFLSFNAKRARGLMANFIIKNQIDKAEECKAFDYEQYVFNESQSDELNWVFTR